MMLKAPRSRCVGGCVRYCMFTFVSCFFFCLVLFTWHKTDKRDISLSQNVLMKLAGRLRRAMKRWMQRSGLRDGGREGKCCPAWKRHEACEKDFVYGRAYEQYQVKENCWEHLWEFNAVGEMRSTHQYRNMIPPFSLPFLPLSVFLGRTDTETKNKKKHPARSTLKDNSHGRLRFYCFRFYHLDYWL